MSYNMDTTCWPHELYMVVQGRVHSSQHGPSVGLYKVDQFVEEFSIEFSCVSLIQELFLSPTLRNKFITVRVLSEIMKQISWKSQNEFITFTKDIQKINKAYYLSTIYETQINNKQSLASAYIIYFYSSHQLYI